MELEYMVSLITVIVALILGKVSKRSKFINDNLIPVQNLAIGIIVAVIEWIITKDFSDAIALSGLIAGGTYDIVHNLEKFKK